MDNLRIPDFEISDDSIPNFDNSEADALALVQCAMRKRPQNRGGGPLFHPKKNETKAGFIVKMLEKPTTTTVTDAGIPQAECSSKINPFRFREPKSLGRRGLRNEFENLNSKIHISDEDMTMNVTRIGLPQASSTPAVRTSAKVVAKNVAKSVQIPGLEININLNQSKRTSPNLEMNNADAPALPEMPSTPERRSVTHLTPTRPPTPRYKNLEKRSVAPSTPNRTPRQLAENTRTPSIKDKFLAELDLQCMSAKAAKEPQAQVVDSPAVLSGPLCSPTHRAQRSLRFGSPKLTVQQADLHAIATQSQDLATPNAILTLKVVVDHQQNKSPSVITEKGFISELIHELTIGSEKLQQTVNPAVESVSSNQSATRSQINSNVEQPIFKTPHIPKRLTVPQNNSQQPIPLAEKTQILSNETDVDAFWLNFDDKIEASPTESKISRTSFAIPRYINPHQIGASQTYNSQRLSKRATLIDIENLEKTIQDSIKNSHSTTRRILYRKCDPSPDQSKRETISNKTGAIYKSTANQVTSIPLTEHIVSGQSLLQTCPDPTANCNRKSDKTTSKQLNPKVLLKRIDDDRGLKSIYHDSGSATSPNSKSMTQKSLKRNYDRRDTADSEVTIVELQSSSKRKRQSKNFNDENQSIPLKTRSRNQSNIEASKNLERKRKAKDLPVQISKKGNFLTVDIHAEGRSSLMYSPQTSRQPYSEKTLLMHNPSTSRTKNRSNVACPSDSSERFNGTRPLTLTHISSVSHFKVPEDNTSITEDETDCSFQQSDDYTDKQDSPSKIHETDEDENSFEQTNTSSIQCQSSIQSQAHKNKSALGIDSEIEISNNQCNESDFLSPDDDDDESTLVDIPLRQISVRGNNSFADDKKIQERTYSRRQSRVQLDNRSKSLVSPDNFQSSDDDEDSKNDESAQNQSNVQSSVQDSSRQSSVQDDSRQSSVQDDSRQSSVQDDSRRSSVQDDSHHSSVQDDNRKQTNLSESDSSDFLSLGEDETSHTDLRHLSKQINVRAAIQSEEMVINSRSLRSSSNTGDNSATSSSTTGSIAASKKVKNAKPNKKRKIKFVDELYDPSKKRLVADDQGLRRSKREYRVPHKYWTSRVEPISPIVLIYKPKPPTKKPIIRKNKELAQAHLNFFNTEFSFSGHDRKSITGEQITEMDDGVIVRGSGITSNEINGVQYWHHAIQAEKRIGYIRIPTMCTKKKTITKKPLDILVLQGSVIVNIGENEEYALTNDQIRINAGSYYELKNTEQADAILFYTK